MSRPRVALVLLAPILVACTDPIASAGPFLATVSNSPPTSAKPGTAFPQAVIRFADANGSPLAGARVDATGDGTAVLSADRTDGNGRIGVQWTLPRWAPGEMGPTWAPYGIPGRFSLHVRAAGSEELVTFTTAAEVFRADQIDASADYGCGVTAGEAWCWGFPSFRLAGGWHHPSAFRLDLPGGVHAEEIRIGPATICIRDAATNQPWCLGVEQGPLTFRRPDGVPALRGLVDAGLRFCGLGVADSLAWCWSVANGVIGPATPMDTLRFASLDGQATGWRADPVGYACGRALDGTAWCWGENFGGVLGTGDTRHSARPVRAMVEDSLVSLRAGMGGVCADAANGDTWCWGSLLFLGSDPTPRRLSGYGPGPFTPGEYELYRLHGGGLERWFLGSRLPPFLGDGDQFIIVDIVEEGQACIRGSTREVYCSWQITHGGSDSQVGSAQLRPVHKP